MDAAGKAKVNDFLGIKYTHCRVQRQILVQVRFKRKCDVIIFCTNPSGRNKDFNEGQLTIRYII